MRVFPVIVTDTASGLDPEIYKQSGNLPYLRPYPKGLVSVETAPIRVRVDSQDPTATVGVLIPIGGTLELQSAEEVKGLRMIRTTGVSADVTVTLGFGAQ